MQSWIEKETKHLRTFFRITDDRWSHLVRRLNDQLEAGRPDFYDEVVWTFLLGISYAASGWDGIRKLESLLSGTAVDPSAQHPIRLEALPMPPRSKEGNTNVDLAIGAITDRPSVKVDTTDRPAKEGGIAYDPTLGSSITFCEMKWYSDISKNVTHDQHRNRLSRVIENAVTFQINKQCVERITVTLVTPRIFVGTEPKSRLYHYKLEEYKNPEILLREWQRSYRRMPKRSHSDWKYPENDHLLDILTNRFTLQHLSFEELFEKAPESAFTPLLQEFLSAANGSQNRFGCDPSA
ncbi:MAG: hypothetical protein KA152_00140 [Verrucomicrobiales bacterium]|nr:hypothetical protein [Verrucomicrobiales bacterium]MBP9224219.1 hypothetical protein [Verrucomicrobiales bacterium]